MRQTKKVKNTITLGTKIDNELDVNITNYCTENNISRSEFVRDAADYYLNILTTAKQKQDYTHTIINSIDSDE